MENKELVQVKKQDRRIVKTKRAICNAFIDLLAKKDVNQISITDIAETADVNRKTVYNYYTGVYEILDEIENEIIKNYEKIIINLDLKYEAETPSKIFHALAKIISDNIDFYSKIVKIEINNSFRRKIIQTITNKLKKDFFDRSLIDTDKIDIICTFIVNGMISAYVEWVNTGKQKSLDELSTEIATIVMDGLTPFIRNNK